MYHCIIKKFKWGRSYIRKKVFILILFIEGIVKYIIVELVSKYRLPV